ncbi:MAG: recombinase family protein [Lachnospiraceae bacterium]|nr:recombinase family protein [Lachnospiraceae bacterium]
MKIGYVRVSTKEQNTARQEELMKSLDVDKVYIEKMSGRNTERPFLQEMMNFVREGDSVVVESISRFARNTKDLLELTEELNNKHVQFISQKENIDTNTPAGKFMLTIFGAVAELEREYIRQRQKEGIEIAKEQGKYKGRPAKQLDTFDEIYQQWKSGNITATSASMQLNISRSTFYRKVTAYEADNKPIDF